MNFNLPYILFFIPLIGSLINQLFSSKKLDLPSSLTTIILILLTSLFLVPFVLDNGDLVSKISMRPVSLIGEYKVGIINIFFIVLVFTTKFADLFRYNRKLLGLEGLANKRFFYAVYFINYFAIIGTLLTNNIFNLFIYLEIYSFTFYAIVSNYKDYKLSVIAFKYFLVGVFGSILILLSVLGLYLVFRTADISQMSYLMKDISNIEYSLLLTLFIMFVAGILTKFFTFWIYFSNINKSNTTSNFLFISFLFVHIYLGTYLLLKLIYSIFNADIYSHLHFGYVFILSGIGLVMYYSYKLLKSKNLFYIVLILSLIDLGYIFINLGLGNLYSLTSVFMLLSNHFMVNSLIFFIASFLIYNYKSADITFLKVFEKYRYTIICIFIMKLFFPFTVNLMGDWHFGLAVIESGQYYLFLPFILNKIAIVYLIGKIYKSFSIGLLREKIGYNKRSIVNKNYKLSFLILFSFIAISIFYSPMIKDSFNNLSRGLLNIELENK